MNIHEQQIKQCDKRQCNCKQINYHKDIRRNSSPCINHSMFKLLLTTYYSKTRSS